MTVCWWRVLAVWPLASAWSVAGTVVATLVTAAARTGDVGLPGETGYVALWVALLAVVPAVLVGAPVLAVAAVVLRRAGLAWQVLTVSWVAAWAAAGFTTLLHSPWGPFRTMTVDPAAPYPWENAAGLAGLAAIAWGQGSGAAWAVVRPVRPTSVARAAVGAPEPAKVS
jgi:hypothetical protein